MADFGFSEEAKAFVGSGLGATLLVFLRHPGSLVKAAILFGIAFGCGWAFGPMVPSVPREAGGAIVALVSLPVAAAFLRNVEKTAEKFDLVGWFLNRSK